MLPPSLQEKKFRGIFGEYKNMESCMGPFYWYIPRRLRLYSEISTLVSSPVTYYFKVYMHG